MVKLFKLDKNLKLSQLKALRFKNEKQDVQKIIEKNLNDIFGLEFVASEFSINDLRFDTLAFDPKNKSFVIIEYKKEKNSSLIDQGYAYLSALLDNKAEFILAYNKQKRKRLDKNDVDWSQTRVIFISPQFTRYQTKIRFKDLPFELWKIAKFEDNIILLEKIELSGKESINILSKTNKRIQKVSREIRLYTEEYHLKDKPKKIIDLYEELKEKILELGEDIEIRPRKKYIGFISKTNFVDVRPQKSQIKIWLNLRKGELKDPMNVARDVSNVGHWGNGDYQIVIKPYDEIDLDYIIKLIKQSYEKHS